jgi:DNA-binding NtrC family response regulator
MTPASTSRRQSRVLLVDDEPLLLAAMQRALRREPITFLTATSASEALSVLAKESVDAVVSDQDMPGMGGVELLSRVSKLHPMTVRFMLTGKATLDLAIEAINKGAIHRFLTKPMEPALLVKSLTDALAQKTLMEQAWKLVHRTREQAALLHTLENQQPGITHIERDTSGAIVLEEPPQSLEELLAEVESALCAPDHPFTR